MSANIIDHLQNHAGLRPTDLAQKLGVSRAQISKWKAGESIPSERREQLNKLAGLFGDDTEWALASGSESNASALIEYIHSINEMADVPWELLSDSPEIYGPSILILLAELGVKLPSPPPSEEQFQSGEYEFSPFDSMLLEYLNALGPLEVWCQQHLSSDDDSMFEYQNELESYCQSIALRYVPDEELRLAGVKKDRLDKCLEKAEHDVKDVIRSLCEDLNRSGKPFATDYFDLWNKHPHELDDQATISGLFDSVDELLPYAQREVLREARTTNKLLVELHIKLDTLLSDESKTRLSKELKYCNPLLRDGKVHPIGK